MYCEECGSMHNGSFGTGRFCSASCRSAYTQRFCNDTDQKHSRCIYCDKPIYIKKRASHKTATCARCASRREKRYRAICKACGTQGCSYQADACKHRHLLPSLVKYFGFAETVLGTPQVHIEYARLQNKLYNEYWVQEISSTLLAERYGYPDSSNLGSLLLKLGIPLRTKAKAQRLAAKRMQPRYASTQPCRFKHGWHTTWQNARVYYRSSYELDYIQELDKQCIPYTMESFRIPYWDSKDACMRVAIPDVFLSDCNTLVEIKSEYTYDIQNMSDRIVAYVRDGFNVVVHVNHKDRLKIML